VNKTTTIWDRVHRSWRTILEQRRGGRRLASILIFVLSLSGFAVFILWIMGNEAATASLQTAIARIVSSSLNLLGQKTEAIGTTVSSARFSIAVVTACTGLFLTAVYLAAVLAYPARWLAKLLGAGIGLTGIFTLNIVRLVSLFYVGLYFPRYVDQVHLLIWQSLTIVFSLFLWLFWAGKVAHAAYKH